MVHLLVQEAPADLVLFWGQGQILGAVAFPATLPLHFVEWPIFRGDTFMQGQVSLGP